MSFFGKFFGVFSSDLGIDLGTANTLVAVQGRGIVVDEPSVVAVKRGTKEVLLNGEAVGDAAKIMMGKTPGNIHVIRPMKDGVIADFDITEAMLKYFIRRAHGTGRMNFRPRIVIAVPLGITAVEKRAVKNSAINAGARTVYLISEPMAAAVGAGLPVADPVGSMVVDIGGGTSEVAVISMAGVVSAESLRVGGDELDHCIVTYIKRKYKVLVGDNTAEKIKFEIGSALPLEEELTMKIRGRDLQNGMPKEIEINSTEITEAIKDSIDSITNVIKVVLERTEPELAADLIERGITLAGGTCQLRGMPEVIFKATGLPVRVADDPLTCVARGCAALLEDLDSIKQILDCEGE